MYQSTVQTLVQQLRLEGIRDPSVLDAILDVPRQRFVGPEYQHEAYENYPLPIGYGQTISQPYIVAHMTELVLAGSQWAGKRLSKVLEIGTGCGYQAAVLAELVDEVYSIERIQPLYEETVKRLKDLNISNVHLKLGDGFEGWPEYAPYQGIIVTASPTQVPEKLVEQLEIGGRMVIPLEKNYQQILTVIERREKGYTEIPIEPVRFVPMIKGV